LPTLTNWINRQINEKRIKDNEASRANHKPSGRLSAGSLFRPVRSQLMKTLGVPMLPFDAYTLGVFDIGNDVEAKFVQSLHDAGVIVPTKDLKKYNLEWDKEKKQAFGYYKETIGLVDAVVDTTDFDDLPNMGVMPFEVKSCTSYKYKHIKKMKGDVDWHYKLQACQNALIMGSKYFAVVMISKEHPDPHVSIFRTREIQRDVDLIITKYDKALANWKKDQTLPKYEADHRVKWVSKYSWFEKEYAENDSLVIKTIEGK